MQGVFDKQGLWWNKSKLWWNVSWLACVFTCMWWSSGLDRLGLGRLSTTPRPHFTRCSHRAVRRSLALVQRRCQEDVTAQRRCQRRISAWLVKAWNTDYGVKSKLQVVDLIISYIFRTHFPTHQLRQYKGHIKAKSFWLAWIYKRKTSICINRQYYCGSGSSWVWS